ncbi:hypothetical protein BX600DRAFT_458082 [Xylariales sp. PMI_506]|nr:hypothetical protein BX600DRAFT_458082 [Xylariales sp. PMI_506]
MKTDKSSPALLQRVRLLMERSLQGPPLPRRKTRADARSVWRDFGWRSPSIPLQDIHLISLPPVARAYKT